MVLDTYRHGHLNVLSWEFNSKTHALRLKFVLTNVSRNPRYNSNSRITMAKELSSQQKKDYAKLLFLRENLTQKEIAKKVGTTEKTLSTWVTKEHWDTQRKSLLVTKEETLAWMYTKLEALKKSVDEKKDGVMDSKDADQLIKITAAIKNMEHQDISLAEIFGVAKKTIHFAQAVRPEDVDLITEVFDEFIKETLNKK